MLVDSRRLFQVIPQNTAYQNQTNASQSFNDVTSNLDDVSTIPSTTNGTTSTTSTPVIVGAVVTVVLLGGLLFVAVFVPIKYSLDHPKTTSTSTTSTTATTTTTTTANPYACSNMTLVIGYDLPGLDITSAVFANYTLCCNWCLSYSGCVAFTWGLPTAGMYVNYCFLKYGVPAANAGSQFNSAHF